MKNLIFCLIFFSCNIVDCLLAQTLDNPSDIIDDISTEQMPPQSLSINTYVSSVNLTGNFNELVVVVGFPDRILTYPVCETSENYPLVGSFPDGTLLKDYVAQNGNSIPADEWFQPALNNYFTTLSGGLYNVNFQFIKSSSNGGTYLTDHFFSDWVSQNGGSNISVIYNKYPLILREIADKLYNDNPNIFNNISCIHFIFSDVSNCEFKYSGRCSGGTINDNFILRNVNNNITYWSGPISLQRSMGSILHERLHVIGKISHHPNFVGLPDRGSDPELIKDNHNNMFWDRDIMYHNGSLRGLHSLYGEAPILSHDLIFLGWIKPEEILTINQANINSIDFNNIKLADINIPLDLTETENGYRRIIKVMIKENYLGGTDQKDEYFLIEYHNASQYDKSFENLDEYSTYGYNKGVLIWHIKEAMNMLNQGGDNLIQLETAIPYNGWNNNPIQNDDYPRNYTRITNWNGIRSGDFSYLDDNLVGGNNKYIHLADGGKHIWETTVINDNENTYGWDPTGQRRFFRFQSMRSDFFTDENIRGYVTNSMTDATRPSTKTWGGYYTTDYSQLPSPSEKTHIAITDITRHTGYMSLKVYYNYWTEDITTNTTLSGNVFIGKNITISPGVELTVQTGAILTFLNGASLTVDGTLTANGTPANKITFDFVTPNSTVQNCIRVNTGGNIAVSHSIIKNGYMGIYLSQAVATIANSEITSCTHGICITGTNYSATTSEITNCKIHSNIGGFGFLITSSSPTLIGNEIYNNFTGVFLGSMSQPNFGNLGNYGNNNIHNNTAYGIYETYYSTPFLGRDACEIQGGNNILENNGIRDLYVTSYVPVIAENNWWGSISPSITKIYSNYNTIDYDPWLRSRPTQQYANMKLSPEENLFNSKFDNGILSNLDKNIRETAEIPDENVSLKEKNLNNKYVNNEINSLNIKPISAILDSNLSLIYKLGYAKRQIDLKHYETAQMIAKEIIEKYPDSSASFFALGLLWQASKVNDLESYKTFLKDLGIKKSKKELYGVAEIIESGFNKSDRFVKLNQIMNKYKKTKTAEYAYLDLFMYYAFEVNDKIKAKETGDLITSSFPNTPAAMMISQLAESNNRSMAKKAATSESGDSDNELPTEYKLLGNYPNPFNPSTTINYALPIQSNVEINIFDIMGRLIRTFELNGQSAGYQNVLWNGKNENNEQTASGIYLYRFKAVATDGKVFEKTSKLLMLK